MRRFGLLVGAAAAVTGAAAPGGLRSEPGWSLPAIVVTTSVDARPALVADAAGLVHLFYLDREGGRGVVRWLLAGVNGAIQRGPRTLGDADLRASSVAAALDGREVRVAWVAPEGEQMRLVMARVRGDQPGPPTPATLPAEDVAAVALAPSPAGVHTVWSQASAGRREIWHLPPGGPAAAIGPGDAPGLSVGPGGPVAVWWDRTGFDTYRLVAVRLDTTDLDTTDRGVSGPPSVPLTGSLATSRLEAPAVAHGAAGRLLVVFGTEMRGLGPPVGRLSSLDVAAGGRRAERRSLAANSPFAAQAVAVPWRGAIALAWMDLRSGRSRNPEIYVGISRDGRIHEDRLTYSLRASTRPALAAGPETHLAATGPEPHLTAAGPGPHLAVAWIEVTPGGRFDLMLASTARPVPRRFLLGIPELDLRHLGQAAAFAATVLVGTLPYAVLLALATVLSTAAVIGAGRAVFGEARWWAYLAASGRRSAVGALAVSLVLLAACRAVLFPVLPRLHPAAAAAVVAVVWIGLRRRRDALPGLAQQAAVVLVAALGIAISLAFAWAARSLSQLAI